MDADLVSLSGYALMFVLGLRHGLDPDHIAMIDSMVYRSLAERPRAAAWVGTWFALGHGLTVTLIAVLVGAIAGAASMPAALIAPLAWLPTVLLLIVGTLNLRDLLGARAYQVSGWKHHIVPARLRTSSHPFAMLLTGVVFALVFDTATQAAAWGYAASAHAGELARVHAGTDGGTYAGTAAALAVGLTFTAGMVNIDTLDGRLMVRLLRRLSGAAQVQAYRRKVGWLVVAMSYAMALYSIASHCHPQLALGDTALTIAGALLLALVSGYAWMAGRQRGIM